MILVLGGARSGKSTFAEQQAAYYEKVLSSQVLYIATAIAFDKSMKDRIQKHQNQRPSSWHTLEKYKGFDQLASQDVFNQCEVVLVDCMTLLVSNLLLEYPGDFDTIECEEIDALEIKIVDEVEQLVKICQTYNKKLIIVSNEVGLGLVPPYRLGSIFRDIAGRINQQIAKSSEEVYLLTAGIVQKIKG